MDGLARKIWFASSRPRQKLGKKFRPISQTKTAEWLVAWSAVFIPLKKARLGLFCFSGGIIYEYKDNFLPNRNSCLD